MFLHIDPWLSSEVKIQSDSVVVDFEGKVVVTMTLAQAWALQDSLRNAISPSAAHHKCPECGGLGAPSHPCPKTGLTCSCCFECTERCSEAKKAEDQTARKLFDPTYLAFRDQGP